jgi:hypothetical protein
MSYFTSTTCPTCQTDFERVPFERDANGAGYAVLEVIICCECGTALCACCSQFACDACGQTACSEHMQEIDGLKCCGECHAAITAQPIETFHCPACMSNALRGHEVTGSEPGYSDREYRFTCLACGATGGEEELVREVVREAIPAGKPMQRETRTPNELTQTA